MPPVRTPAQPDQHPRGNTADRLLRESLLYAASKAAPGASTVLLAVLLVALLRPEGYAYYAIALANATVVATLATGWLRQAALRHSGDQDVLSALTTADYGRFVLAPAPVVLGVQWLAGAPLDGAAVGVLGLLYLGVVSQLLATTRLQSELQVRRLTWLELARGLTTAGVTTCAAVVTGDWTVTVAAYGAVLLCFYLPVLLRPLRRRARVRTRVELRGWWGYGWPMSLWMGVNMLATQGDRLVINRLLGPEAAGTYASVADVVVRGVGLMLMPITMASTPRIMRLWNSGQQAGALRLNRRAMVWQLLVAVPIIAVGPWVLTRVVPAAHGQTALVAGLLCGAFLWQLSTAGHKRLELQRRTRLMLLAVTVAAICGLSTTAALVGHLSLLGGAVGYAGAALLYLLTVMVAGSLGQRPRRPTAATTATAAT